MKNTYAYSLFLLLWVFATGLPAQSTENGQGGNFTQTTTCLPAADRSAIQAQLNENIRLLGLQDDHHARAIDDLIFPLRMAEEIPGYFDYQNVSGYVDHDPSNGILDYHCESLTYDGHKGSDYFTFPFQFYLYTNNLVEVIAAAPGVIISKQDGNNDVNCSPAGSWNAVYVRHNDGSIMWYGHLKNGSLTNKNLGDQVAAGEYLGILASSGFSTGPHLHIEYYDATSNLLDPYEGNCNELNNNSLWAEQVEHTIPKVNAVLTHSYTPNLSCGLNVESVDFVNEFYAGDRAVVAVYLTQYQAGTVASTRILRPNGTLFDTFNTFNWDNDYGWFWNSRSYWLDEDDPEGEYTIECTYEGVTYTHTFLFQHELTNVSEVDEKSWHLTPNPTSDQLVISGENWQKQPYRLLNSRGQEVDSGLLDQPIMSLQHLSAGLYYLVIGQGEKALVKKVVKQ